MHKIYPGALGYSPLFKCTIFFLPAQAAAIAEIELRHLALMNETWSDCYFCHISFTSGPPGGGQISVRTYPTRI